jgi:predicted nucleotidyltransferase
MLDLSERQELEWLAQLVADIRAPAPGIEPLLVGALARDLLLHYGHGFKIERATTDVDFALAVANWEQFSAARAALLASGLSAPHRNTAHTLQHERFGWIDLIPFGAVERSDGTIAWPPAGDEVMAVIGYAEAAADAMTLALPKQQTARVVSLPMLAVLKVLAWKDRHRFTQGKDAEDLQLILRRYLEAGNLDRLYAEFPHVITDRFDFEPTGAWLLGRDARATLQKHSSRFGQVREALNAVIEPEIDAEGRLTLVLQLTPNNPNNALKLLAAFHAGLTGATSP